MTATILIADDDPVQRRLLEAMVRRFGYQPETVDGGEAALDRLGATDRPPVDLLILDLVMPDLDGMGVLGACASARSACRSSFRPRMARSRRSFRRCARRHRFRRQAGRRRTPASVDQECLARRCARGRNPADFAAGDGHADLQGHRHARARKWRASFGSASAPRNRRSRSSSKANRASARNSSPAPSKARPIARGKPFITVNCGALPENLVESILFGHEKGAFTGATDKHVGKFVEANGGTLFLDEVGELPLDTQVKLLRALQEGEIDPVGAKRPVKVDVRLISATNQNLIELVKRGDFREDLLLSAERVSDHQCRRCAARTRTCPISRAASPPALRPKRARPSAASAPRRCALLSRYDWPGNVRQLENAVFRAVVLADGDELTVAEFPQIAAHVEGFDVRVPPLPRLVSAPPPQREIVRVEVRDPNVLPLLSDDGNVRPARRHRGGSHSLCAFLLSRPNVRDGAAAAHRALDALSQNEGFRPAK